MPALIFCYSPEDAEVVRTLGDYLARNVDYDVCYEEGAVGEGFDLVNAAERGLSAEAALVLLSPRSVPKTWNRDRWEPVFLRGPAEFGTLLGFVLLETCKFPELLRRHRFFDASEDLVKEARRIRRWLLRPEVPAATEPAWNPAAVALRASVGERPAVAFDVDYSEARIFAEASRADFEGAHEIDCHGRSRAGILADIGRAIGLPLAGNVTENRAAVKEWFRRHRWLLLIQNAVPEDRDFLDFGGLASAIFTTGAPVRARVALEEVAAAFLAVPRHEEVCAAMAGEAIRHVAELLDSDFEAGLRLGWAVVLFLRATSRFAEAIELLDTMEQSARGREDTLALYRINWELSWLREPSLEDESVHILPTAGEQVTQLSLF